MLIRLGSQLGMFDLIPQGFTVSDGNRLTFPDTASATRFFEQFRFDALAMRRLRDLHRHVYNTFDIGRYPDDGTLIKQMAMSLAGLSAGSVAVIQREEEEEQSRWHSAGAFPVASITAASVTPEPLSRPITDNERRRWAEALETEPVPEQKYKIVIEVAGKHLKPLVGWLDLRPIPDGDDDGHDTHFKRDTGSDNHRVVLRFDNVPNKPRQLYYVIGTCQLPLCMNVTPVEREAEAQQWSNVLIPLIPVWRDDTGNSPERDNSSERDNSPERNNSPEPTNTTTASTDEFKPLPPGWLYVYLNGHLWREVQVCNNVGVLRDVDLAAHAGQHQRPAKGQLFKLLLVPHKLNSVTQTVQLAYARQQWNWTQLCNAGGINPDDPRFLPPLKQRSANTPIDSALQNTHLKKLDLSSYDQGFEATNDSGQSGHSINAVATAPPVMDEELPPWPAVDKLAKFRDLNIPVVALNIGASVAPIAWVKVRAYYNDTWQTALPAENVKVSFNNRVFKEGLALNQGVGQNTASGSLGDAQQTVAEPGVTLLEQAPEGEVAVEFVREAGVEQEIASLRASLRIQLDAAYRDTVTQMSEFQQQWDEYGYAAIALSGAEGLYSGASEWLGDQADLFEAETWSNLGDNIAEGVGKTLDYAADYASETYDSVMQSANAAADWVEENSDELLSWNWWSVQGEEAIADAREAYQDITEAVDQHLDDAIDFLGESKETLEKLLKHKEAILQLPKHITEGDAAKVEKFVDTILMDLDPEMAQAIKNNPDFHLVLELIADHDSTLTYFAYLDLYLEAVPPNFYAYLSGKGGAYVAIEVLLLVVLSFLSLGTGTAARVAMLAARLSASAAKTAGASLKIKRAQAAIKAFTRTLQDFADSADTLKKLGKKLFIARNGGVLKQGSHNSTLAIKKKTEKRNTRCRICKKTDHSTPRSRRRGCVVYK